MATDNYEGSGGIEPPAEEETQDSGKATALLPKSMFGQEAPEPGTTCTLKVVHAYDDEVEVEFVGKDDNADDPEETAGPSEATPGSAFDQAFPG